MTTTHKDRLQLFISNVDKMKHGFTWQSTMMKHMAALLYTAENKPVDTYDIRHSYDMVKENTGVFSMFRGNTLLCLAAMLALSGDSQKRLDDTRRVYDILKGYGFGSSDFLVVAAYQIATGTSEDSFMMTAQKMRSIYDGMKALHPFLTSRDDYIFTAMLALSDVETDVAVVRMEELYRVLKRDFRSGNGVQALTEILVLGDHTDSSAENVLALRRAFRNIGLRMENQYTLPTLGILSLLPGGTQEIAGAVSETFQYLRSVRGFGAWSFPKQELLLHAAALATYEQVGNLKNGMVTTALATSITNLIIAQQAAMAAAAASSASAAASAAN